MAHAGHDATSHLHLRLALRVCDNVALLIPDVVQQTTGKQCVGTSLHKCSLFGAWDAEASTLPLQCVLH